MEFFTNALWLQPVKKIPKYSGNCQEFNTFFLNIMWINLASFSVVLSICIFLHQFVFSAVQRSRKIALNSPLIFSLGPGSAVGEKSQNGVLETCLWCRHTMIPDSGIMLMLTDSWCCWQYCTLYVLFQYHAPTIREVLKHGFRASNIIIISLRDFSLIPLPQEEQKICLWSVTKRKRSIQNMELFFSTLLW